MLQLTEYIRKLAKSDYYQSLYSIGKEMNLQLFNNKTDFTQLQMMFLKYINFYSNLFADIALGDVDELVLENDIYEDSYMMYKNKKDKNKFKNPPQTTDYMKDSKVKVGQKVGTTQWIFKNNPKVEK